jgi:alanine-glyoxylate transaminase/serine-glyoxylate transaminase/serine-pyruvate transaminase
MKAIICIHGVFGNRLADMAERFGAKVHKVEAPWGKPIDPDDVRAILKDCSPKLLAIVHAETSTGVLQPLQEISQMVHEAGALFVVDAVTSYCGTELRVDDWGIDAIYSGTQKCLSAPPGLSPVSFSQRSLEAIDRRKSKVQSWFLDINLVRNYWAGAQRTYHHTAPVSSIFALYEAYRLVLEEGLTKRWQRHHDNYEYLRQEIERLGFTFLVDEPFRLPMLNAVVVPEGINEAQVRASLLNDYNIEIGAGLGQLAGKIWRVGLMGESSTPAHIDKLISALKKLI